jgi:hypothetical protein
MKVYEPLTICPVAGAAVALLAEPGSSPCSCTPQSNPGHSHCHCWPLHPSLLLFHLLLFLLLLFLLLLLLDTQGSLHLHRQSGCPGQQDHLL